MAEVDFILTPEEQARLIEHLLGRGLSFVPDLRYSEPRYVTLNTVGEIRGHAEGPMGARLFFIMSPMFTEHPLEMRDVVSEHDQKRFFHVVQRQGGPYLDLLLSTLKNCPTPLLISGFSGYYRSYWISKSGVKIAAPKELKALHKSILVWLRDHARCVVTTNAGRRYWVGAVAEDMLLHGVRSNVDGLCL